MQRKKIAVDFIDNDKMFFFKNEKEAREFIARNGYKVHYESYYLTYPLEERILKSICCYYKEK